MNQKWTIIQGESGLSTALYAAMKNAQCNKLGTLLLITLSLVCKSDIQETIVYYPIQW